MEENENKKSETCFLDLNNEIQSLKNKIREKDKEIQEKDKIVLEKDKIIQGKNDLIQGRNDLIQEKNDLIQEKDSLIQQNVEFNKMRDKGIQNMQEKYNEIQEVVKKLNEKIQMIQKKDCTIQENDSAIQEEDSIIKGKDSIIQEKDKVIQQRDNKIQELIKKIQEKDKTIEEKDKKIQEKDKEIRDLELDNDKFKKEAYEYQYALGAATNFRLSDNDENNSVKFKEDIIKLRHSLENYITKCKGSVEINIPEVQNLLKTYGSQTDITKDQKKPLIRVAIQRHVIEQIIEYAKEYFDNRTQPKFKGGMESFMHKRANELIEVAEAFARMRDGIDDTTKAFPIKLRQQIFAALGNRGFNNVVNKNNQNFLHDFINDYQSVLNKEIDKYRKLKDPEKKKEIEDMAGDIIRKVVTLFWFRFKVQEPIAEYVWFKYKEKIDPSCMEGIWDDEDIDDIVVDICHFPLITNKSTGQIYTPAKVFHIHNEEIKKSESSEK